MFKRLFLSFTFIWIWAECNANYNVITPNPNKTEKFLIHGGYIPENDKYSKFAVSIAHSNRSLVKGDDEKIVYGHFCAGTIIGLRTILTSAFCLKRYKARDLVVIAGAPELTKRTTSKQIVHVKKTIMHPLYRGIDESPHDIGVMHLSKKLIEYPDRVEVYSYFPCIHRQSGTSCTFIGWGVSENSTLELSEQIRYIDLILLRKKKCDELFGPLENTFCAGDVWSEPGGACIGDSGGPVFCHGDLSGIAYYTMDTFIHCDRVNPTYFVDICKYVDWIKHNTVDVVAVRASSQSKLDDNINFKMLAIIIFVIYFLA